MSADNHYIFTSSIKEYFKLQLTMINRKLVDFGIKPVLFYPLATVIFIALSMYFFYKTSFAGYAYLFIALSCVTLLNEVKRNDFLKLCFLYKTYWKIRCIENFIIVFPFIAFLIFKLLFIPAALLMVLSILLVFTTVNGSLGFVIPTPFYKRPFEFTVGFRNTFFLFIAAWFVAVMAVKYQNFNLGAFSLLGVFIICLSFYSEPENEFFVWIYNLTPAKFLFKKIRTALLFTTILSLPVFILMTFYYPGKVVWLILIQFSGYLYITTIILAKYTAFPGQMNLPLALIVFASLFFPPLLIGLIPFLYFQSVKRLNLLLNDHN